MRNKSRHIVLVCHNLRSCHNVGSLLRTAEGLGVQKVYLTGYTPYPHSTHDVRLPHIANKIQRQIDKTALGADKSLDWEHADDIVDVITNIKKQGFIVAALEQSAYSINIMSWQAPDNLAIVVGRETEGIEPEVLAQCNSIIEIPMSGKKESFNVVQAAAMALFYCSLAK